jgi:hypothetical protein
MNPVKQPECHQLLELFVVAVVVVAVVVELHLMLVLQHWLNELMN